MRVVKLASTSVVTRAAAALRCEDPKSDYAAALKNLRAKVFAPLS